MVMFAFQSRRLVMPGHAPREGGRCLSVLAIACLVHHTALAGLTVLEGPLAGQSLYSCPRTRFIGPQPPTNVTVRGPALVFLGDACQPAAVDSSVVSGRVVLFYASACSFETQYWNFNDKHAAAIIEVTRTETPSLAMNFRDDPDGLLMRRPHTMPYLYVRLDDSAVGRLSNISVSASPDVNVWGALYTSWVYQVALRWVPAATFTVAACLAAWHLFQHVRIKMQDPDVARLHGFRFTGALWRRIGYQHAALALDAVVSATLAIVYAVGGWYSTSNLPGPAIDFFVTNLSGAGFAVTCLSSAMWLRQLDAIDPSANWSKVTRLLRGDRPAFTVVLCVALLTLDTSVSVLYTTHFDLKYPGFDTINGACFAITELVYGIILVRSAVLFKIKASGIRSKVRGSTSNSRAALDAVLARLSHCAIGLGGALLCSVVALALIPLLGDQFYSPTGWPFAWSLYAFGRSMSSIFRVIMLTPRRPTANASITSQAPRTLKVEPPRQSVVTVS